ncbi:phosphoribosylformylglycinamidine cyclo-ligase [Mollicutes bacterium LVI A0078]|nr:phosphoribosylformylglycinamidine cyclo-ligase [Mollicutes bacterium LVI A0075]WOO91523.1 phosphoribosylformylglycinamidine cyclo-ligase [Mollicutes bacterium LVI A0078]
MNAYAKSGVDVERGYAAVEAIKSDVLRTHDINVINNFGSFGGLYDLSNLDITDPVLVSGTDGVGSKLVLAIECQDYTTIGQDLVAMSVNDIVTIGAKPLYFLDYIAVNKIDPQIVGQIVKSICDGLVECDCSLVGGETAEMGNLYQTGDFDLAGFVTGVVSKSKMIDISSVKVGDAIIGLGSNGIHSNGYTLVRKTFEGYDLNAEVEELGTTLGTELLKPTKIYVNSVLAANQKFDIKSAMHITGGGFYENIERGLSEGLMAEIKAGSYPIPAIFDMIQDINKIDTYEMHGIFNMGIGMCLICNQEDKQELIELLEANGETAFEIGVVKEQSEDSRVCIR